MTKLFSCRRTFIAVLAIGCLTYLGSGGQEIGLHIATIAVALAGANAWQKKGNKSE